MRHLLAFALAYHSITVRADMFSAAGDVCARLLRATEHLPRRGGVDPVREFFVTFDDARVRASLGAFGAELERYAGTHSLLASTYDAPHVTTAQRASAYRYRTLFKRAAPLGEDFVLARMHLAIDHVSQTISEALDCGRPGRPACRRLARESRLENELATLREAWLLISPVNRAATLDWLGRELVEALIARRTYRIELSPRGDSRPAPPREEATFPNAERALNLFLIRHADEEPVEGLRQRYYRGVAGSVLGLFGIGTTSAHDFVEVLIDLVNEDFNAALPAR